LLRIMAGFEQPTAGEALMWASRSRNPSRAAAWSSRTMRCSPWLSVRENIGFGPAARGLSSGEVKATVEKFIDLVGLAKFANAYPHQLSGA